MKILFIGDIVGRGGRRAIKTLLPKFREENEIDFCIANGENMVGGNGFTPEKAGELLLSGIDFYTTGNHVWGNKNGVKALSENNFPIIRPANYPNIPEIPGKGFHTCELNGRKILVINLIGRVFMGKHFDCPFRKFNAILEDVTPEDYEAIIVDFHAEATSEKIAFKHFADGKVSAILGTHTHVQTADEQITEKHTAYITDCGMTGPIDSVLGVDKEKIIESFLTQMPTRFDTVTTESEIQGVIIEIENRKALSIKRIKIPEKSIT